MFKLIDRFFDLSAGLTVIGCGFFAFAELFVLTQDYILLGFPAVILYALYLAVFKQGED